MKNNGNFIGDEKQSADLNLASLFNILNTGPGIRILLQTDFSIRFASNQFYEKFYFSENELAEQKFVFLNLFDPVNLTRFKSHAEYIKHFPQDANKYAFYKISDNHKLLRSVYIYISYVNSVDSENFYNILLLPDVTDYSAPFISSDTENAFLKQIQGDVYGTFEWIPALDMLFWSEGLYNIFELDKSRLQTSIQSFTSFVLPNDLSVWNDALENVKLGKNINVVIRIVTANKNLKYITAVIKWVDSQNENPIKIVASVKDISKEKKIEDDLKNRLAELNRSNKELEEFAYVASHDMQEPLRKINAFSERLAGKYTDLLSGEGLMCLQRIMASAENMRLLINDLLEFSRISKSTQPFTQVNLNFILQQVKNELEITIDESNTQIQSQPLPTINASVQQMKQLFINLIGNSIKFRKAYIRPIVLLDASVLAIKELEQHDLLPGINYVKLQFTDNGIGFDSDYAEKIFQIFQRLHGKSEFPGSGIGLAICKKIVDHHKGKIFAENIPGCGARFTVILPQ